MEIPHINPIKVLYADDDPDDIFFFKHAFNALRSNAVLTIVEDGDKLIKHLAKANGNIPDIIFLDINMPLINGKECLVEIRKKKELNAIPVIMLSTSSNRSDIEETFANGANLYISKYNFGSSEAKILKEIFDCNWQETLFNPDMKRFALYA